MTKHDQSQKIFLEPAPLRYAGYCDFALHRELNILVRNDSDEDITLTVKGKGNELFAPFSKEVKVPFGGAVSLNLKDALLPRFLLENDNFCTVRWEAEAFIGEQKVAACKKEVTALPFDFFEGLDGIKEKLCCFVRPQTEDAMRILKDARRRLKRWNVKGAGYTQGGKAAVRKQTEAIFSAVRAQGLMRTDKPDLRFPVCAAPVSLSNRQTDAFRLALFAAACLERANLNPVLILGEKDIAVGVWLTAFYFPESSSEDLSPIGQYASGEADELICFDAEDLFPDGAQLSASHARFSKKLDAGKYRSFLDLKSCRLSGFTPCPARKRGTDGYELEESAPTLCPVQKEEPKNKLWERELLDFSGRNSLLCFQKKNALELLVPESFHLTARMKEGEEIRIVSSSERAREGDCLYTPTENSNQIASKLKRRNRETFEETGARILFLAYGFLQYGKSGEEKTAPLLLFPADLVRAKGGGYALAPSGEYFLNSTLLEYLRQEYNVDLRGLADGNLPPNEILKTFRREAAKIGGWKVIEESYLAVFSFQRYFMWNDLRTHFSEFEKNENVRALFSGKKQEEEETGLCAEDIALPLASDSSQREAVALCDSGRSFVLCGPPGTGKSQTITNLIANALGKGKTVLFVAEKKAAIDVVKKRLSEIGLGDFCLEADGKLSRDETLSKLMRTLELPPREEDETGYALCSEEYRSARESLDSYALALSKKRDASLSVYEAIAGYLERKDAPTLFGLGGAFYEMLDEKKLARCKELVYSLALAAKECGGVFNTPFENVNVTNYSPAARDKALSSARALLAETNHLRGYLSLVTEFINAKIPCLTREKLRGLKRLIVALKDGTYSGYFGSVTQEEFSRFYGANLRLDRALSFCAEHFRVLINIDREREELEKFIAENGDYRLNKTALSVKKRLERVALHPVADQDVLKYIETLVTVFEARKTIAKSALSKNFTDRSGRISEKKRQEFLAPLKELCALSSSVFTPWNPESFFAACVRAESGCARPVFEGFLRAAESFGLAAEDYLAGTAADRGRIAGEDILGYFSLKAAALVENIDHFAARCAYKAAEKKLGEAGMKFISDALESGKLTPDNALCGFEKSVYSYFLSRYVPSDPVLARMTAENVGGEEEKFRLLSKKQRLLTRAHIRSVLLNNLPREDELREERALLYRLTKKRSRGALRTLFTSAPALMKKLCPCLLMSPDALAQYLSPEANTYDLVIFDEASQMTTAEAIPALARAKQAIVVGDANQLPPTSFFRTAFSGGEETELMESVLDEAVSAGFTTRSLLWHYRSRHESLIAFSNAMYYGNRLNTFPSPDAHSRVSLRKVDGVYDRGRTKRNRAEAEALCEEVIKRLSDPQRNKYSMGVVTFSDVQKEEIERLLYGEISKRGLEEAAFGGAEPLFIKNLENVQGDERDVILFSVCYGFDREGRLNYNFGPLNRDGGWRRLNVACSRAREEMIVFSGVLAKDIDLTRTSSKGVAGLKAFLEFAEKGRAAFPVSAETKRDKGMGKYLAHELTKLGYDCRVNVGAGNFKIDVAVTDPDGKDRYILGILIDGGNVSSAADRAELLPEILKKGNWNLCRVSAIGYFNNPKRELKRIKDTLDALTGRSGDGGFIRYERPYRFSRDKGGKTLAFLTEGENGEEIKSRLDEIVSKEEPISRAFLKRRCLESFGIVRAGAKAGKILDEYIGGCAFSSVRVGGTEYFYKRERAIKPAKYRNERGTRRRRAAEDFTPFETAVLIKGILEEKVTLYNDELVSLVASVYGVNETQAFCALVNDTLCYGEEKGMFSRSPSGRISLR